MTLPRTLILAAALAAPTMALADGATELPAAPPVTTAEPVLGTPPPADPATPVIGTVEVDPFLELPETPIELPDPLIEHAMPEIELGEGPEFWDDCPGCGMG